MADFEAEEAEAGLWGISVNGGENLYFRNRLISRGIWKIGEFLLLMRVKIFGVY